MSKLMGAHIELCKGSNKQNISYIRKKEDIIEEIGEPPVEGSVRMAEDLIGLKAKDVRASEVNSWLKMNSATHMTKEDIYKPEIEVYYIWGDSATGKTKYVYDHIEGEFDRIKYVNGFWLGVPPSGTAETAWYDDFRGDMPAHEFISFIDYYVNQLNCKGFSTPNKFKKIFITSVLNPEDLYKNLPEEPRKQWMRRLKIVALAQDTAQDAVILSASWN